MTPNRPYLLRALHEWIVDNGMAPHILVDATLPGAHLPPGHVQDGRITLNVSPSAVRELLIGNELLSFRARFGGRPFDVSIPVAAVLAIFARESGQGMAFSTETPPPAPPAEQPAAAPRGRPQLKVIKRDPS